MSDSTQQARELLSRWIEQRTKVDFLTHHLELRRDGILDGQQRGVGYITEIRDSLLRLETLDGDEVQVPIDGTFIVEFNVDHSLLVVRSPNFSVSVELKPHAEGTEL